jgi:hypothetical protein
VNAVSQTAIIYPLLVQVALTFVLLIWLARERMGALNRKEVRPADIALREPNWPKRTLQVGNSFLSQLELPLLFYLLTVLALTTRMVDVVLVVLAWAFVLARVAHAVVHTTHNDVGTRGPVFGIGMLILLAMWLWFATRFLTASLPL